MFDNFLNNDTTNDVDIVFKDLITIILLSVVVMFMILLVHINPPSSEVNKVLDQPGRMGIELVWSPNLNVDLDLWVKQGDNESVGFPRKDSPTLNLVRDDLGNTYGDLEINFENVFVRSLVPGEYIINVHLYNPNNNTLPINALVKIRVETGNLQSISTTTTTNYEIPITFTELGQELTAIRFAIDEDGLVVENSISNEPIGIRSLNKANQPTTELPTGLPVPAP